MKTTQQFKEQYYEKFPNSVVNIIGEYINSKTKIEVSCKTCGNIWNPIPSNLLKGCSCPKCRKKEQIKKLTFTKEQFVEKYNSKYPNKIDILGEYVNAKTKIVCKCKKCQNLFSMTPDNLLKGEGCICLIENSTLKKTTQQFKNEYYKKFPNSKVIIMGEYIGCKEKIKCQCEECNYEWETTPDCLLRGSSCYRCRGHIAKTTKEFKDEYYEKFPNSSISIIGEYKKENIPIKCKCNICQNIWETTNPHRLLNGCGCPKCSNSKGNNVIKDILTLHNINYVEEKTFENCKMKCFLRFDFFLPKYNILIEYDGEQHFTNSSYYGGKNEFNKRIEYDNIKNTYCKNNNIFLLRIPYKYKPSKQKDKIEKIILDYLKTKQIPKEIVKFYNKYTFSNYLKEN